MQTKKNPAAANSGAEKATTSDFEYNTSTAGDTSQICDPVDEFNEVLPDSDPFEDMEAAFADESGPDEVTDLDELAVVEKANEAAELAAAEDAAAAAELAKTQANPDSGSSECQVRTVSLTGPLPVLTEIDLDNRQTMGVWYQKAVQGYMRASVSLHDQLRDDRDLLGQQLLRVGDWVCDRIDAIRLGRLKRAAEANGDDPRKVKLDKLTTKLTGLTDGMMVAAYQALYDPVMVDGNVFCRYIDDEDDPAAGIYVPTEAHFIKFVYDLTATALTNTATKALVEMISRLCPRVEQSDDANLLVLNNGIFNYAQQTLHPFDREFVSLSKASVALNLEAENPVIDLGNGQTWDVESWVADLSDGDSEVERLYWQLLGAALRARHPWEVAAIFYESSGRNGKGTFLQLMRNLVGEENCVSMSMSTLEERFGRGRLLPREGRVPMLVTADENGKVYLEKAEHFKEMVTHDPVEVEEKSRAIVQLTWRGFIVQCINDLPKTKETSGSISRRLRMVPFTKRFRASTDEVDSRAVANKSIKTDYIGRQEVLEYVARRVLTHDMTPEYYELSEPQKSKKLLKQQQLNNDTVQEFWEEFGEQFVWDLVPWKFVYDLYKAWLDRTNPTSRPKGSRTVQREIQDILIDSDEWTWTEPDGPPVRPGERMSGCEMLIVEYDLEHWVNERAGKSNPAQRATLEIDKQLKPYRGLIRTGTAETQSQPTAVQAPQQQ